MKCLVVVAHPLDSSLCTYLASETIGHLENAGHDVEVKKLYAEGFDGVLNAGERASYYGEAFDAARVRDDIEQLQRAEMLVLVFPTWWFGFPAILKGWFDRVWVPGYAYLHAKDNGAIIPNLMNLKRLFVVTSLGSPWWVDWLVMWRPVSRILRIGIMGTCAKGCEFNMLSIYKSESLNQNKIDKFVEKIKKAL